MTDELDLTPLEPVATSRSGRPRSWRNIAIMGTIGLALVAVIYLALTSARVFFYNVDEAIALRSELEDQNFRMQGTVVSEKGLDEQDALLFTLAFGGETAEVRHVGDEPSDLFAEGEKVVVEGSWDGEVFRSHLVLVKHSEEYVEDNPERLDYDVDPAVG